MRFFEWLFLKEKPFRSIDFLTLNIDSDIANSDSLNLSIKCGNQHRQITFKKDAYLDNSKITFRSTKIFIFFWNSFDIVDCA
ncbi:hypothetical protein BpHYR1_042489 [Brachionus plicatilis]|uniref:Uncharacterized protein n=1 Tax=Brachionus plicatilis TaxID=10195 RepID=A0A3M7SXM4_BRAPC|nr:hypothetical protein BpHYR1_042489 [Brachionus plicatilis]